MILTNSTYKNELDEWTKYKLEGTKKNIFSTGKNSNKEAKKVCNKFTIKNIKEEKQKKKENPLKKFKKEDLPSTSKNTDNSNWYCPLHDEEKIINMIMCKQCLTWFHEECLGIGPDDEFTFCHCCEKDW